MAAVAAEIAPHLAAGATVTDVGSVKRDVIEQVGPHLPAGVQFIPSPACGDRDSGGPPPPRVRVLPELFDNRYTLRTPVEGTDPAAVARLRAALGGLRRTGRGNGCAITMIWFSRLPSHTPH